MTRTRREPSSPRALLLDALTGARPLAGLTLSEWDVLVRAAQAARVLSQLAVRADASGMTDRLPAQVRPHLESARIVAARTRTMIEWEIGRIELALRHVDARVVLLKGAAYQAIALPTADGRLTSDVDILVARDRLAEVERALADAGWRPAGLDPRDEEYFRRGLHELPPLRHHRRRTLVDVHHAILPPTDPLAVDPRPLLERAIAVPNRRLLVLSPPDMFLHSAAHLFRNGAWTQAVRDFVDMDAMLRRFGALDGFWSALLDRTAALNLTLPCASALRAVDKYFGTPLPDSVAAATAGWRHAGPTEALLESLVDRALFPRTVEDRDRACERARRILAYWPVPRLRTMRSTLFWTKRIPRRTAGRGEPAAPIARADGAANAPE